jgi:hypothetical protein
MNDDRPWWMHLPVSLGRDPTDACSHCGCARDAHFREVNPVDCDRGRVQNANYRQCGLPANYQYDSLTPEAAAKWADPGDRGFWYVDPSYRRIHNLPFH